MKKGSHQTKEAKEKISNNLKGRFLGRHTKTEFKKGHKYLGKIKRFIMKHGYKHKFVNGKYRREHHLIWMRENQTHRIPTRCVVHHINGIRTDNRRENLQLLDNPTHTKLHITKEVKKWQG